MGEDVGEIEPGDVGRKTGVSVLEDALELRCCGAVCDNNDGFTFVCRGGRSSFGEITSFDIATSASWIPFGGTSTLEITLPRDVGGVGETSEAVADGREMLSTDVEAELAKECGADFPFGFSPVGLVIWDIRRPAWQPGLLDRLRLVELVGLGKGCESNMCTCRSRTFFGIVTPVRDFPGGTPTRRQVGGGDEESSAWMSDSTSGIAIT
jgi:hypothetical protein